ncbi:MAG: methyltransferase domain-containing protein [Pseudomonadota bacterium]
MTRRDDHVDAVAAYYDSASADAFYARIWGGEDIHIGLHDDDADHDIAAAGARMVDFMADRLGDALHAQSRIIDLGAGYGGSARRLARRFGCAVTCVNLSAVQNARNERLNAEAGLAERITVVEGDFAQVPQPDGAFDVVWSQDAFLHAADQAAVIREAFRLLAPGGRLIFTDPMQRSAGADPGLAGVYARLNLTSLRTPDDYGAMADAIGFADADFEDLTPHHGRHYAAVRAILSAKRDDMPEVDAAFADRMLIGLDEWVAASNAGKLAWGVLTMRKPG